MEKIKNLIFSLLFLIIIYAISIWIFNVEIVSIATDKGAALASMFGWIGAIFTGFIAIYLFTDWKEQKRYEIQKQYAEEILKIVNTINIHFNKCFFSYISLTELPNKVVYLNIVEKSSALNIDQTLYELEANFKTLFLLNNKKINESFFNDFENYCIIFQRSIIRLEASYKNYYDMLDGTYKNNERNKIIHRNQFNNIVDMFAENSLIVAYKNDYIIELNKNFQGIYVPYQNNFKGFKTDFDKSYQNFVNELLSIIKL